MKTLVIVPGWGGSHETWAGFIALAKKSFDVHCIDLPCFGSAPEPESVWGVAEYAEYLANEVQKLQKKPSEMVLLAHSFGGQVATKMLASHPNIVGRIVFTAPAVFRMKANARRFIFGTLAKVGKFTMSLPPLSRFETLGKNFLYRAADSPDYNQTSGVTREIFKKVISEDVSHLLSQIKIPTLIVWGSRDKYVPLSRGKRMLKMIPQATLEIIPKATHGIHISHGPRLLELINHFAS